MKQNKLELSTSEKSLLKGYFQTSPLKLIRLKSQAMIMHEGGLSLEQIANFTFRTERTIYSWVSGFLKIRMASIFTGHSRNKNANKLTNEQKLVIKEALSKPPSEYGLPKAFWDVPQLKEYIATKFDVIYESDESYYFLLKFSGLSFKYPDTFSVRRNEELIKQRIVEIKAEIAPLMEDPNVEVFAADETRMELEAIVRKAWLKRGERTVLKVNQSAEYQSYFGVLNQKTFQCKVYEVDWQNQENIISALKKVLDEYPNKKICIIWDNARFHKGKLIQEALRAGGSLERVHLINFPPYAPDHNPIEKVWGCVKAKLANQQFESFDRTKEMFMHQVNNQTFNYSI